MAKLDRLRLKVHHHFGKFLTLIKMELQLFAWATIKSLFVQGETMVNAEFGKSDQENWSLIWKNILQKLLKYKYSQMTLTY